MQRWRLSSVWLAALGASASLACGDSQTSRATVPFTVWVFDERLTLDGEDRPLANVRVAFDPAGGGERVTRTTDPDGHVTIDADLTQGPGSVTVLSDDHVYVTMLEASPDSARARPNRHGKPPGDLVILPPRVDRVTTGLTVELRGNIFGLKDPTNEVVLSASSVPRLGTVTVIEPFYVLRAPRDRSFFLLGHALKDLIDPAGNALSNDLIKSFRIDLPARNDDELLDLELATLAPLPTRPLRIHAEMPRSDGSPFVAGTRAYATVSSADSGLQLGIFAGATPTADGRGFDVDVTLAETDIAPERPLTQATLVAPDGSRSTRMEPGIVPSGAAWTDFQAPPTVPDPDAPRTTKDAIPLSGFPAGADLEVQVLAGGSLFWILHGPPGGPRERSFTIPYRDEVRSTDVQVFAVSVVAQTDRVVLPTRGELYRRASSFRDIHIRKR